MTTLDAVGEREVLGESEMSFSGSNWRVIHTPCRRALGSLQREAAAFYRLSVPSCGSSLSIKNDVWCMLLKTKKRGEKT